MFKVHSGMRLSTIYGEIKTKEAELRKTRGSAGDTLTTWIDASHCGILRRKLKGTCIMVILNLSDKTVECLLQKDCKAKKVSVNKLKKFLNSVKLEEVIYKHFG